MFPENINLFLDWKENYLNFVREKFFRFGMETPPKEIKKNLIRNYSRIMNNG